MGIVAEKQHVVASRQETVAYMIDILAWMPYHYI